MRIWRKLTARERRDSDARRCLCQLFGELTMKSDRTYLATLRTPTFASITLAAALACGWAIYAQADSKSVSLKDGFANPPAEARPRVWWHWMNGNISKAGIEADLDWMSRIGIGGLQNFDAALNTPQIVDERLVYMSPGWKDAFRFTAEQAQERDLELAIAASPGWSETGGPWVAPEDGMKKVVWSEMTVAGGQPFEGKLPALPQSTGMFQDLEGHDAMSLAAGGGAIELPHFARDAVVLAVPITPANLPEPSITAGEVSLDAALLGNGLYRDAVTVPRGSADNPAAVVLAYAQPITVRALTLHVTNAGSPIGGSTLAPVLEVEQRAGQWEKLADVPLSEVPTTVSFPAVTAQRFRVLMKPSNASSPLGMMSGMAQSGVDAASMIATFSADAKSSLEQQAMAAATAGHVVSELSLHAHPRVNAFEFKAAFSVALDYYALAPTPVAVQDAVSLDQVVDLTDKLSEDGRLEWTPPPGTWKILRLGYSLTGKINHPAPPEATGLEVDKFDGDAVRRYMETYLNNYRDAAGEDLIGERGLRALLTDSIEVGASNWTPKLVEQFERLRGYDPTPWLPTLTGIVVGSGEQSDAFLYDYRRTLAELIASEHYGVIAQVTAEQDLTYYSEAVESIRTVLGDDMAMRAPADVPMAAMWTYGPDGPDETYLLDMRGAASVAHIYGQNIAATESLTSVLQPYAHSPALLRPVMDLIFASGINRPVIHASVHQPADDKFPGLALLIFGQYFNRHETWAEMAKPWVDYMARSSFLLQQGRDFADVAYFYGEEAPLTAQFRGGLPDDAPTRYGFDFINADALRDVVSIEGGDLVTEGGARYSVLYLGGSSRFMTLPTLRRIAELVDDGATVVGSAPQSSPSLADDAAEFSALVKTLWQQGDGGKHGKGRVIVSNDVESVLAKLELVPDVAHATGAEILFRHRRLDNGDIYFLSNRSAEDASGEYRFRVSGRVPELWRADTGETRRLSYRMENDTTVVDLPVAAKDALFVVFRDKTRKREVSVPTQQWQPLVSLSEGPWQVVFQEGRGAPATTTLASLQPLNEHSNDGIRYFSGVASYSRVFDLSGDHAHGSALQLDLGAIGDVAEVYVNGELAGTAWREPYRVEVGQFVQPGRNTLEVKVANLWVNRLIGDVQPNARPVTWTSTKIYLPDAPLRPSGLLGPVTLLKADR